MGKRSPVRYITDPAHHRTSGEPVLPTGVFDQARLLDACMRGLITAIPPLDYPSDELLVSTLVAHGQPRWSADQIRYHPGLRYSALVFWSDVRRAARGDKESQGRVDGARAAWDEMRRIELIHPIPNHTIGLWER